MKTDTHAAGCNRTACECLHMKLLYEVGSLELAVFNKELKQTLQAKLQWPGRAIAQKHTYQVGASQHGL